MKLSFRWYGEDDPVKLEQIRQIPNLKGIVTAIYDIPVGEVWPLENITELKSEVEASGLALEVIESLPVHEEIKLGSPARDRYIENYKKSLENLGRAGIRTVCYNFMPVFDWTRTTLNKRLFNGATTLAYDHDSASGWDPVNDSIDLPGWATAFEKGELQELIGRFRDLTDEDMWNHLSYFLKEVVPVAEAFGIKLAIHPDDPPWPLFGLPRIITNRESLDRVVNIINSGSNGLTVCTGSLGADPENDLVEIVKEFGAKGKIHFLHFRNVKITGDHCFEETAHLSSEGSLNMGAILKTALEAGFEGPIRPDHGRMIWGEEGRPGYGLYDRALGCAYINGLHEAFTNHQR